jgi:hypothetical protein
VPPACFELTKPSGNLGWGTDASRLRVRDARIDLEPARCDDSAVTLRTSFGVFGVAVTLLGCAAESSSAVEFDGGAASTDSGTSADGGERADGGTSTDGGADTGSQPGPCHAVQCDPHAACTAVDGGAACQCQSGWTGDGTTCADIDECASGTAKCDAHATCTNTPGSYTCACNPGYMGDGMTCTDIDECTNGTAMCAANATCTNIPGGYKCDCAPGYVQSGSMCVDIDECANGTAMCDPKATCTNTPGSYTCTCNTGYTGNGKTCTDIDECANGTAMCAANATCTNTPGSYTCACNPGYLGNGKQCAPVGGMGVPGDVSINAGATTTTSASVTLYLQEPGDLITNPGGETGDLSGWTILQNGGSGWAAAAGDPPIHLFGQNVSITSYALDTRDQLLDLIALGYTQAQLDAAPPIAVREWYHGGGYNTADSYYLKVELRDASNKVLASLDDGATMTTTNGTWQSSAQTFTGYGTGLRYVYFEDGGHDVENWLGSYGASMDEASVVVGAVQMRISNDNMTWTAWQPFVSSTTWTLAPASGMKTVYVQYQDANNKIWPPVSATITLQ